MTDPITIRAFRAIDEPDTCRQFYEGHINALRSYGIEPISSSKLGWDENPCVYGVIAERNKIVLGGVKLHQHKNHIGSLPIENSVGYLDEKIYKIVEDNSKHRLGELCGLWNAREIAGKGFGYMLLRALVAITSQAEVDRLISLSSDHTIHMLRGLGYRVIRSLGNNGEFFYPTPKYIARVMLLNCRNLSWTTPYNKVILKSLRKQPEQYRTETGPKGDLEIIYKLDLSKGTVYSSQHNT